ncbi:MAG: GNAT family N-acetyltransferase [Ilumatobacteraceae bacterium]
MDTSDRLLVADAPAREPRPERAARSRTERAALVDWPFDPSVAMLQPTDHTRRVMPSDIEELVERADEEGRRAVRTSALFPGSADSALRFGFTPIDELVLMRRPLEQAGTTALPTASGRTRRLRRLTQRHLDEAARLDVAAFGPLWGHDRSTLSATRSATASARARGITTGRRLIGFAISGRTGRSGYLQRLAIDPAHRRRGLARLLATDAMRWMARSHCVDVWVNTSVSNTAALHLYESLGFERRSERLIVAEFDLAAIRGSK